MTMANPSQQSSLRKEKWLLPLMFGPFQQSELEVQSNLDNPRSNDI